MLRGLGNTRREYTLSTVARARNPATLFGSEFSAGQAPFDQLDLAVVVGLVFGHMKHWKNYRIFENQSLVNLPNLDSKKKTAA